MSEKAKVALVDLGFTTTEGLLLPIGDYCIAVPQIANIFCTPTNYASQTFKRLLGVEFRPHKIKTELGNQLINVVDLSQVQKIARALDKQGNELASQFIDACIEEALDRRFDHAFNKKREEDEYNLRFARRMQGKPARASLTEAIQEYQEKHQIKDDWIYKNCTQKLYAKLTGVKSTKKLKEKLNIPIPHNMRDYFSERDLLHIQQIEDYAARLILMKDYEPLYAMEVAIDLLLLTDSGLTRSGRL